MTVRPSLVARLLIALVLAGLALSPGRAAESVFFTVAKKDGVWWFIDPQGRETLSIAVNKVIEGTAPDAWDPTNPSYSALRVHPSVESWQDGALARMASWGFNMLGPYSEPTLMERRAMPFTVAIPLGSSLSVPWVDLWSPDVEQTAFQLAEELTAPWREDPLLVGYFADNENPWWDETLFGHHLSVPWRARADGRGDGDWVINQTKLRLFDIMNRYYEGRLDRLNQDWEFAGFLEGAESVDGVDWQSRPLTSFEDLREPVELRRRLGRRPAVIDLFIAEVSDRYGELVAGALRAADPNHLVLGERYQQFYTPEQVRGVAKWFDVMSINKRAHVQDGWVSPNHLALLNRLSDKPVLVSEHYFAATENTSGSPNTGSMYPVVQTQAERAAGYATQVRAMASTPSIVGWHWFQYFDQPPEGDGNGENFNMGLVDTSDRVYPLMAEASTTVNREAYVLHARARWPEEAQPDGQPAFAVSRAVQPPVADGDLRDWNKSASWLPGVAGRPYGTPIGDVFLSATPGRLHVAAQYQFPFRDSYYVQDPPSDGKWPVEEGERVTVAMARLDGSPLRTVTWVLFPGDEDHGWRLHSDTGGAPLDWSVEFGEWNHGAALAFEGTIPVPVVTDLMFTVEVRSRADHQTMHWGRFPLHQHPESDGWGRLTLPVDADAAP